MSKPLSEMSDEALWQALQDAEVEAARLRQEIIGRLPEAHQELLKDIRAETHRALAVPTALTKLFPMLPVGREHARRPPEGPSEDPEPRRPPMPENPLKASGDDAGAVRSRSRIFAAGYDPKEVLQGQVRFLQYLDDIEDDHAAFTTQRVRFLRALFKSAIESVSESLPPPQTGPTQDDTVELVWDQGHHHVSIELFDDVFDWFYRNRATDESDGGDNCITKPFPPKLKRYLKRVVCIPP